ncbi:MAG: GNAT family N-acetyltransferase [Rikenellaceae bacterium]
MIRKYQDSDRSVLCDFFMQIINEHKDYISHGELQMGIALDEHTIAPDAEITWLKYLDNHVQNPLTKIFIYQLKHKVEGFIISGIEDDGAEPYGIIYDMGVNPTLRGKHIGSSLIEAALSSLNEQGIDTFYLESGVNNHSAHSFFEKFGFHHVSNIYRLKQ